MCLNQYMESWIPHLCRDRWHCPASEDGVFLLWFRLSLKEAALCPRHRPPSEYFLHIVQSCDINILPRISRTIHKYWLDIEYWGWQNVEDGYGVGLNINCLIKAGVSNWFCIRGQFIKSEREAWWCCSTLQLFKFYSEDWRGRLREIAALKYSMDYGMPWLEVQ